MFLLVPVHPGSRGQRAVIQSCMCVCVCYLSFIFFDFDTMALFDYKYCCNTPGTNTQSVRLTWNDARHMTGHYCIERCYFDERHVTLL